LLLALERERLLVDGRSTFGGGSRAPCGLRRVPRRVGRVLGGSGDLLE